MSSGGTKPTESKFSWADDAEISTTEKKESILPEAAQTDGAADPNSLEMAQKDGATQFTGGSEGLDEPEFDVNVKLADLQEDPNNPLYSVKTFAELNLFVSSPPKYSMRKKKKKKELILCVDARNYSLDLPPWVFISLRRSRSVRFHCS